ncbi:TVP38/TMEM64 family protein [Cognaticolwellia beringensis]|uniref:TVP38/TMEM64 family membrane protein n=1 Tax=Cognaticolwellia beringensis TaxID=1967665 RepID=A0A222G6N3_9GAMM|nr:VTT domain-containing protein [Cognaticolwellia beringensis]ASP47545.1 DedA family protein [Cognaticolwellia beringensis]
MFKTKSALKLTVVATLISILLAITLATLLLGNYGVIIQNHLNTIIPNTLFGALLFVLILTPAMAIGLPRQIAALSAGFLFGAGSGMLLATISAVFGCLVTLMLARKLFANLIEQHYPQPLAKVSYFFSHNTFLKALTIRLLPAGSNFLTNILAGTARSPIKPYILGSALGFVPQMTIFSLMGAGLQINGQQQLILSIILLIIALLLGSYLYRKTHNKLTLS